MHAAAEQADPEQERVLQTACPAAQQAPAFPEDLGSISVLREFH